SIDIFISIHKFFHQFIWFFLALFVINKIRNWQKLIRLIQITCLSLFIQSIIASIQFINQNTIGLFFIGEQLLDKHILGVAKISTNYGSIIRAYGTLPHPNILAGFLLLSICVIFLYSSFIKKGGHYLNINFVNLFNEIANFIKKIIFLFYKKYINKNKIYSNLLIKKITTVKNNQIQTIKYLNDYKQTRKTKNYFYNGNSKVYNTTKHRIENYILAIFLFLNLFALVQTFSRVGIFFALIILLSFYIYKINDKLFYYCLFVLFVLLIAFFPLLKKRIFENTAVYSKQDKQSEKYYIKQNTSTRKYYDDIAKIAINRHVFTGVGLGNFVNFEAKNNYLQIHNLFLQPVHNVYLLAASEMGILLFSVLLLIIILYVFDGVKLNRKIGKTFINIVPIYVFFIVVLIIFLFDHYFYSFPQGMAIIAISSVFLRGSQKVNTDRFHTELTVDKLPKAHYYWADSDIDSE
ncbi:MAG: hypothetical protein GF332_04850, partial [Candidatus Moranbacteria bacterium]|nr:hypothetical protein [Candidatus Moranbacteria bacterium]